MFSQIATLTRSRTRGRTLPALAIATLLISVFVPLSASKYGAPPDSSAKSGFDFGKLHLSFEPNVGQASAPAQYVARAPGSTIYFSPSGVAVAVQSVASDQAANAAKAADAKDAGQFK